MTTSPTEARLPSPSSTSLAVDRAVEQEPLGPCAFVERADGVRRLGHEDAGPAGGAVGSPGVVRRSSISSVSPSRIRF